MGCKLNSMRWRWGGGGHAVSRGTPESSNLHHGTVTADGWNFLRTKHPQGQCRCSSSALVPISWCCQAQDQRRFSNPKSGLSPQVPTFRRTPWAPVWVSCHSDGRPVTTSHGHGTPTDGRPATTLKGHGAQQLPYPGLGA